MNPTGRRETGIWIKFEGSAEDRVPNTTIYMERKNRVYEHNDRTFFKRQPSGIKKGDLVFMAVVSYDAQERETPIIVGYAEAEGFEPDNVIGPNGKFFKNTNGDYPYFVRLMNGQFLHVQVEHGVSYVKINMKLLCFSFFGTLKKVLNLVNIVLCNGISRGIVISHFWNFLLVAGFLVILLPFLIS